MKQLISLIISILAGVSLLFVIDNHPVINAKIPGYPHGDTTDSIGEGILTSFSPMKLIYAVGIIALGITALNFLKRKLKLKF